jgi:uncharacterized protein YbaR (Trm112 family)
MRSVISLFTELRRRQIRLSVLPDGRLKVEPKGAATSEELALLKEHKPELLRLLATSLCPKCDGPLAVESGPGWLHRWCPVAPGHWDEWRGVPEPRGRKLMAEQIARGGCPDCGGPLRLQDAARDVLRCATCALVIIEGGVQ